jgi:hypothetical protein
MTLIAMAGAALMVAHQVAGKAVRDSFFLSHHPASDLPRVVIAAAAVSILLVLVSARLMGRFGPARTVPAGFLLSAMLHLLEYAYMDGSPGRWSVFIYFHIVALGAILLSGFWSLMAEAFDPPSARRLFGRITGFGTLGGISGGLLAERLATLSAPADVLLLLAALHLATAAVLAGAPGTPARPAEGRAAPLRPVALFRRAPYLVLIAMTVLAGTSSAAILDYLFKAGASAAFGGGAGLLRFFALFYISTQVLTFVAQTFLARRALARLGIGRTISALPFGVGAGALAALMLPVFPVFALARSLEFVLRGSLYRSAYELLYTPVPPEEKRAAKTLVDVAFDRAGDALGGGLVQLVLWIGAAYMTSELLGITLALAAAGIWISLGLDGAYTRLLQRRLLDHAVQLDLDEIPDSTTRSVFVSVPRPGPAAGPPAPPRRPAPPQRPAEIDDTVRTLAELRSGDRDRVFAAIAGLGRVTALEAAQLARLLAWDEVSDAARAALARDPGPITGLLVDQLTHPGVPFGIRRRIPPILIGGEPRLAVPGLLAGLGDERFEVRFRCSRALDAVRMRHPEVPVPPETVFAAVERELAVAGPVWNSRRLLDRRAETDHEAFLDEILQRRADRSLEHVFSLFATVLPREPVKIAFRALHTDNPALRGLAAEYLDSVLPAGIRQRLWDLVKPGTERKREGAAPGGEALDRLLESHQSLLLEIDRGRPPEEEEE